MGLTCASSLCVDLSEGGATVTDATTADDDGGGGIVLNKEAGGGGSPHDGGTDRGMTSSEGGPHPAEAGPSDTNLVVGGDFSSNGAAWHTLSGLNGTFAVTGSEGCLTVQDATGAGIGWPATGPAADLVAGQNYTFSYSARVVNSTGVTVDAKVGQSTSPYTADEETMDPIGSSATAVSHPVVGGDSSAGISFIISGTVSVGVEVCFSNVSLVAN